MKPPTFVQVLLILIPVLGLLALLLALLLGDVGAPELTRLLPLGKWLLVAVCVMWVLSHIPHRSDPYPTEMPETVVHIRVFRIGKNAHGKSGFIIRREQDGAELGIAGDAEHMAVFSRLRSEDPFVRLFHGTSQDVAQYVRNWQEYTG